MDINMLVSDNMLLPSMPPLPLFSKNQWQFYNPVRLAIGRGCRAGLIDHLHGNKVLIVTTLRGRKQWMNDDFLTKILKQYHVVWVDTVTENPSLDALQTEINRLAGLHPDAVVGFGGGSAIDAAKVLSIALHPKLQSHTLAELLAKPSLHMGLRPYPLYAISTTAGTGSEVTPFATVWDHQNKKKLSLAGDSVFPYATFVDSELTDHLPLESTISTGLDAINQAAESIWNKNANPITLSYAIRSLQLGFFALPKLANLQGGHSERDKMAEASLLAGLAISHTRTALCHSISYPLTTYFGVPHGLACAFSMPAVLRHNLEADDGRFSFVSKILTGSDDTSTLVELFDSLHMHLKIREKIKTYIPDIRNLLTLEQEMFTPGRADNNLNKISQLRKILKFSWG